MIKVLLIDLSGRVVKSNEFSNIQLLNLNIEEPASIYFLILKSEGIELLSNHGKNKTSANSGYNNQLSHLPTVYTTVEHY